MKTGLKNKEPWEEHRKYLKHLKDIIDSKIKSSIVVGDFNQRIPRKYSPIDVYNKLINTFSDHYEIGTTGIIREFDKQSIDHIATSNNLQLYDIQGVSNYVNGIRVSDHFGLFVKVSLQ